MPTVRVVISCLCLLTVSCQVKPYAPLPLAALVESVDVEVRDFEGRPEAYARVNGRLSSSAAQLVDTKQSRDGRTIILEVLEQTPRGANLLPDLAMAPPFSTRIPVELLGLNPGPCLLITNGIQTPFVIPGLHATLLGEGDVSPARESAISLVDEFIPIEEFDEPLLDGL